jgi:hypothetical protein
MFIIERGAEIMDFVRSILDSVGAIAKALGVVAEKVETVSPRRSRSPSRSSPACSASAASPRRSLDHQKVRRRSQGRRLRRHGRVKGAKLFGWAGQAKGLGDRLTGKNKTKDADQPVELA